MYRRGALIDWRVVSVKFGGRFGQAKDTGAPQDGLMKGRD